LDQLREAYKSLNDITRNLASAQKCLQKEDLRVAEYHLRAAEWHLGQAKPESNRSRFKTNHDLKNEYKLLFSNNRMAYLNY